MNTLKTTKTATSAQARKEFIPGDSGYNHVYPAPQYLPRKIAIIVLLIITIGILFSLFASFLN